MGQGPPEAFIPPLNGAGPTPEVDLSLVKEEFERCNSDIIDVHLHEAAWFDSADPLLTEMSLSHISRGLMLSVYGPIPSPFSDDPNEFTERMINESNGRIYGLASLNTTIPDWDSNGAVELERLATYLEKKPGFVGGKVAAPHSCLPLNSTMMRDVLRTISQSSSPVLFTHIGTTPFCGPLGNFVFGRPACCGPEFVDPMHLENLIQEFTNTTFILVHAGADFLPPTGENFYGGENAEKSIMLAEMYDNVYLEISAFLDETSQGPQILDKIAQGGLASKTIYGSDVNHFPNALGSYLATALDMFIEAGFDQEERCMIFAGNAIKVFGLEMSGPTMQPMDDNAQEGEGEAETPETDVAMTGLSSSGEIQFHKKATLPAVMVLIWASYGLNLL